MSQYDDLLRLVVARGGRGNVTPVADSDIDELRRQWGVMLPVSYCEFLRDVGWGQFGEAGILNMYKRLFSPTEIWGEGIAEGVNRYVLFGDDCSGQCFGFDRARAWCLIEMGPTEVEIADIGKDFSHFIREYLRDNLV